MQVFPRYEFLGWYSTGAQPEKADKELHKKIQEVWHLDVTRPWGDVRRK